MQQTTFTIAKMDCPSEEQMIRMRLADIKSINSLEFDIPNRKLTVYHTDGHENILESLLELKLSTSLVESVSANKIEMASRDTAAEKRLLWQVLGINILFFVLELATGLVSSSMSLVADSMDMLADSIVYGLSIIAVGGAASRKRKIAKAAGYFQLILAIFGLVEVVRRFLGWEKMPVFQTMIIISLLALLSNALCLYLLQKNKSEEAHMQASMIFTSNDVIVNLGVIIAGALVYWTNSKYPDLIVGAIVFFIVTQGAFKILKLAK